MQRILKELLHLIVCNEFVKQNYFFSFPETSEIFCQIVSFLEDILSKPVGYIYDFYYANKINLFMLSMTFIQESTNL